MSAVDRRQAGARRSRTNDVVHRLAGERSGGARRGRAVAGYRSRRVANQRRMARSSSPAMGCSTERPLFLEPFDPDSRLLQVGLVPTKTSSPR